MNESFDAVLADARLELKHSRPTYAEIEGYFDRLQSAHEAEVAERDARIARLQKGCQIRAEDYATLTAMWVKDEAEYRARAEAAERDARRLRELFAAAPEGMVSEYPAATDRATFLYFNGSGDVPIGTRVRLVPDGDACIGGGEGK